MPNIPISDRTKPMTKSNHSDALNLAAQIAKRNISVREATEGAIASIERQNPGFNAVVAERFDAARTEADAMDQSRPEQAVPL